MCHTHHGQRDGWGESPHTYAGLTVGTGTSVPCRSGRCGRGLQRTSEELQAHPHRNLRHIRRSDARGGDSGEAESARPPAARSPGHLQQHGRLRPSHRFGSDVLRWWFIRAFLRAGVDARLVVFDALPNAFWYDPTLPEATEATHIMADFLMKPLNK